MESLYQPVHIRNICLPGNIFLAPVAGYSDKAYRSVCIDWGADFTYTEMVSSEAFVRSSSKTEKLIERADNEKQYAVQIFGANPDYMARTAFDIIKRYAPSCIDINAGCPMPKITKTGAGSALMKNPADLYAVVKAVSIAAEPTGTPVTVKIRSGWSSQLLTWRECAKVVLDAGAAALTLHPRTCSQCYNGIADWNILGELTALYGSKIPVFGSGDLFSPEAAQKMLSYTKCSGVMFARGAMGNPFIFKQTKQLLQSGIYQTILPADKAATAKKELLLLCKETDELHACREMRKRFAAYTKGISGGAEIRSQLMRASTIADYEAVLQIL